MRDCSIVILHLKIYTIFSTKVNVLPFLVLVISFSFTSSCTTCSNGSEKSGIQISSCFEVILSQFLMLTSHFCISVLHQCVIKRTISDLSLFNFMPHFLLARLFEGLDGCK